MLRVCTCRNQSRIPCLRDNQPEEPEWFLFAHAPYVSTCWEIADEHGCHGSFASLAEPCEFSCCSACCHLEAHKTTTSCSCCDFTVHHGVQSKHKKWLKTVALRTYWVAVVVSWLWRWLVLVRLFFTLARGQHQTPDDLTKEVQEAQEEAAHEWLRWADKPCGTSLRDSAH